VQRKQRLLGYGLTVIGFSNTEVLGSFQGICEKLEAQSPISLFLNQLYASIGKQEQTKLRSP